MKDQSSQPTFSPLRRIFFPIHGYELKKFLPMVTIFFFVAFNYALLRGLKDSFVLGLKGGGAEAISAAKFMGVIPAMILFKMLYDTMSSKTPRNTRFTVVVVYFMSFFAVFLFVLYPNQKALEIVKFTNILNSIPLLNKFSSIWLMLRYWPITLFYIHAEAWGTFVLSVGVWTFVIFITNVRQSKRFFSFLSIGSGIATLLAGIMVGIMVDKKDLSGKENLFSIENLLQVVLVSCLLLLLIYNLFIKAITKNPSAYEIEPRPEKKKLKLSLRDSFSILFKDPYLVRILMLVLCYSLAINLFESVYKDTLKAFAGGNIDIIRSWNGFQLQVIGCLQITLLFIAGPIMRRSWRFAASVMPVLMFLGTLIFFSFLFFGEYLFSITAKFTDKPLPYLTISLGICILTLLKSSKYVFFDATKERTYIPLEEEQKITGKSAVDGVGSRLGKGAGAFFVTMIVTPIFGSVASVKPLFAVLILGIVLIWIWTVQDLSVRFESRKKLNNKENKPISAKI